MSTARNPVRPGTKASEEEMVAVLREHLDDADAKKLARRIETSDEDAKDAIDFPTLQRRILQQSKPKP
jgi:hypothetical protein